MESEPYKFVQKVYVSYEIRGFDFHPNDITKEIGLNPTEMWQKGDKLTSIHAKDNFWSVGSGLEVTESIEKQLEALAKKLTPYADRAAPLAKKYNSMIRVAATYSDYYPGIVMSPELLADLSQLGAQLDLDINVYTDGGQQTDKVTRNKKLK